jgi:hypothetical protein
MAWGSLASNQMVSYTDAQGGGFTLNSGQSSVTSNQCMTKNDALTKYALDSSYMSAYASNQLVPKSTWVAAAVAPTIAYGYNNFTGYGTGGTDVYYNGSYYTHYDSFISALITLSPSTQTISAQATDYSGFGASVYLYINAVYITSSFDSYSAYVSQSTSAGNDYYFYIETGAF